MVKNTQGGSSHKKFARKHSSAARSNKLRVSEDEGELYAIVTKMLGNGMFHCHCIDDRQRLGHIRGKFSGRGKRDNMVELGKWVLIGLREWDISSDKSKSVSAKLQQCDLLEVYSEGDKARLKETCVENWEILDNNDLSRTTHEDAIDGATDIVFATDKDEDRDRLVAEMDSATAEKIVFKTEDAQEEEIVDFDDI
jgi:initiation factor 1A